jgi:MFS family permease
MPFQPAASLRSRTYLGLITAQFLAAFNDQTIHASAMFYAIHQETLTEKSAISLMPILFFAPWAVFCTLAGYLADRYSKRNTLVFWKLAEVGITLVALLGFCLGTSWGHPELGTWIVLSTVFLMGTHSAFFVPAKYGALPEILQPHLLSKGNGILESTSFLAVILGTVTGGILSSANVFKGQEYYIGLILVALALFGAGASLLIEQMPAANPERRFPTNPIRPLADNLRVMFQSRPLLLSILGIAFFTFMVAFMRATMYMHGESQHPRWDEFHTSIVVATVALGVGLGSPLAGFLSGGKVELGLVPLGAVGMIITTAIAAFSLTNDWTLIICLILIGFSSGFYIVPLYTLLQHRAPKTSKGDLIATSNFINVTGAIAASLLFYALVFAAKGVGLARSIPQSDQATGRLEAVQRSSERAPGFLRVAREGKKPYIRGQEVTKTGEPVEPNDSGRKLRQHREAIITPDENVTLGMEVAVSKWNIDRDGIPSYEIRPINEPLKDAYDQQGVPLFLFLGASVMTLGILLLLCRQLPDFFVRALLWLRSHGRHRLRVVGVNNLPSNGPVILATNCDRFESCMQVVAATDRFTRFILLEDAKEGRPAWLLRYLARRTGLIALPANTVTGEDLVKAIDRGTRTLQEGNLVGISAVGGAPAATLGQLLEQLRGRSQAPILPVYWGQLSPHLAQVVIGQALRPDADPEETRQRIQLLGEWVLQTERDGGEFATSRILGPSTPVPL